ncbi:MAG: chaperone NapD [Gammaproteobacteria bacterium]|nr:chaperone NapD [Gammaproteobacteria bacterium]
MHVAGVIVQTLPDQLPKVLANIGQVEGAEVATSSVEKGSIIVTIDGESRKQVADRIYAVDKLAGVAATCLVYEETDSNFDLEMTEAQQ